MEEEVCAQARSGIDANATLSQGSGIPCALERVPCRLEEQPVLRVHDFGFAGGESEKLRVKPLHIVQPATGPDVLRIVKRRGRLSGPEKFLIGRDRDGLGCCLEVSPEVGNGPRAWEAPGHADNRNISLAFHSSTVSRCSSRGRPDERTGHCIPRPMRSYDTGSAYV